MKFSTKVNLQIGQQLIVGVPLCDAVTLAEEILRKAFYADELSKRRDWATQVNVFEAKS